MILSNSMVLIYHCCENKCDEKIYTCQDMTRF